MAGVRRDIAKLGSIWSPEIEWYARAVRELWQRPPSDRTSWRYFGAIHGFDLDGWLQNGIVSQNDPLPPSSEQLRLFEQCQHAGWYFLPWHRGYLAAFEAIVRQTIADLGGPDDWCLPYWNYLDTGNAEARDIPEEFLAASLPDGTPNSLATPPRGGTQVLGPQEWFPRDIDLQAQSVRRYTAAPGTNGYGGGSTGFAQFGNLTGAVEGNPHNTVHVLVGGLGVDRPAGWMSDPNYAALDPIFWLHHCNVDRLWAAWMSEGSNLQETGAAWLGGPFPRQFQMPNVEGGLSVFAPADTLPGGPLAPTYDDLMDGTGASPALVASVSQPQQGATMPASLSSSSGTHSTLVGANDDVVTVTSAAVSTRVEFVDAPTAAAGEPSEQRLFLNLENVRGEAPSGVLDIHVSAPGDGAVPASTFEHVETIALFGLAKASSTEGAHAGNGLSVAIDITEIAKKLAVDLQTGLERLDVRIAQSSGVGSPITVERVSLYRQPVD